MPFFGTPWKGGAEKKRKTSPKNYVLKGHNSETDKKIPDTQTRGKKARSKRFAKNKKADTRTILKLL